MIKKPLLLAVACSFLPTISSQLFGQAWIEGTWSARGITVSTDDEVPGLFEANDVATIALVSGSTYTFTVMEEDGPDISLWTFTEQDGFFQGSQQGFLWDNDSYDFDFIRLYPIDADTGIFMGFGTGGSSADMESIYWMDATIAIFSRNELPPAASLDGRAGTYRGWATGADVGFGVDPFIESVGTVEVTAAGNGYSLQPNDGDEPVLLQRGDGFLFYDNFSTVAEGEVESLAVLPLTPSLMAFARFDGNAVRFDPFQNFWFGNVEVGLVSSDPAFVLPSFVPPPAPDLGPISTTVGGWVLSSWLGYLFDFEFPWIYSLRMGWTYMLTGNPDGAYFYDPATNSYFWTSESSFPYRYMLPSGPWQPVE